MSLPATDQNVVCLDYPAAAGLVAADQFKFVEMNSSGQVLVANALTDLVVGVLYSLNGATTTVAGDNVVVAVSGKAKVKCGAAVAAAGVFAATDATGRMVTGASGNRVAGMVASTAGAAGELAEVNLTGVGALIP